MDTYSGKGWNFFSFERLNNTPGWLAAPIFVLALLFMASLGIAALVLVPILVVKIFSAAIDGRADDLYKVLLGLVGVLGGPIVIWRVYVAHQQVRIARESHYTTLFTKAVEQLGATREVNDTIQEQQIPQPAKRELVTRTEPNLEVRLGAIYALERIAQDSERDHWPIMEVLCAYIRNPQNCGIATSPPDTADDEEGDPFEWSMGLLQPRVDIQAALTVLARRRASRVTHEHNKNLVLDLNDANLQNAKFGPGNFARSQLTSTKIDGASLLEADFSSARFRRTSCIATSFTRTVLDGAQFFSSDLRSAFFVGALLRRATFNWGTLSYASFSRADLTNAVFRRPRELVLTDFSDAILTGCVFERADLSSALGLNTKQLSAAKGDERTRLPDSIERPGNWPDYKAAKKPRERVKSET